MNTMIVLVRRELWENRSLWMVPLIMAGVLLLSVAIGGLHINDDNLGLGKGLVSADHQLTEMEKGRIADEFNKHQDKADFAYAMMISVLTMIEMFAICVVVFFYLLDCLLQERKDRSILFWKSLPISDGQVVTSKVLTALALAPLFTLLVSGVLQILVGAVVWLRFSQSFFGDFVPVWKPGIWLEIQAAHLMFVPTAILWYLPIAGYLMLVSIWSRKNALLWAVLPWVSLLLIEGLLFQSHRVADFLGDRFAGVFVLLDLPRNVQDKKMFQELLLGEWASHIGNVYASYKLWLSIAAGIAFFYAAVRIRRYRDEN